MSASAFAIEAARADIVGSVWEVSSTVAGDATLANVPAGPATVTFALPNGFLSLDSRTAADGYTIGGWLATDTPSPVILTGASHLGDSMDNTLVEFTGTVSITTGTAFNIIHDDGLTLVIGGTTVVDAPGGTPPTTTPVTYTGPSGNEAFTLVYGECCGPPAVLSVSLPLTTFAGPGVPEASTWAMMLAGFAGLGFAAFRRSRKAAIGILPT